VNAPTHGMADFRLEPVSTRHLPESQSKESARLSRIGQHYREHVVRNIKVGSTFNLLVRIKSHDILERSFIC
jgi:hypothetical protein